MAAPIPIANRPRAFLNKFTLSFADESYLVEALHLPGAMGRTGQKKLAQIGDSALRLYYQQEGYDSGMSPGEIDNMVQQLACNAHLARCGSAIGLEAYVVKNPSQGQGRLSEGQMATTVEAIMGAAYLSNGRAITTTIPTIYALGLGLPE